jgi:hypothetical protein
MSDESETLPQFVRDMIASPPPRGEGLNNYFFRVARVLHAFRSKDQIIELLSATTYGEPIKHGEIERAVERSESCAWNPGQPSQFSAPAWSTFDSEKRRAVTANGGGLVDLWEASPVRFVDNDSHTEEIIDQLFPGDPFLCVGDTQSQFDTRTRNEWRGRLSSSALIVPSPMTARRGLTQEGKESAHALLITGPRRFLVIEQDRDSIDDQAAVLLHLAEYAPLVLALHSGGKSAHGWFICHDEPESRLRGFMEYAVTLGCDRAAWTRSQFVRMPDGRRENGKRQTVFFFNPGKLTE